jgi:hypothetical protein
MRYQLNATTGVYYIRRPQAIAQLRRALGIEEPQTPGAILMEKAARWLETAEGRAHVYGIEEIDIPVENDVGYTLAVIDDGRPVADDNTFEQE